jgi:hypothetical protein
MMINVLKLSEFITEWDHPLWRRSSLALSLLLFTSGTCSRYLGRQAFALKISLNEVEDRLALLEVIRFVFLDFSD